MHMMPVKLLSKPLSMLVACVSLACLMPLPGCTTQPQVVREFPPIPPQLAAPPEKLKPLTRWPT